MEIKRLEATNQHTVEALKVASRSNAESKMAYPRRSKEDQPLETALLSQILKSHEDSTVSAKFPQMMS